MKRAFLAMLLIVLASTSLPFVHCDRGMIPVYPGISVYEPGQKAIIAWNGQEEILILSTDVYASEETMVLEILPLPSIPEVETASFQSFITIQNMIWKEGINEGIFEGQGEARLGSVEVLFHEQIGAHNITVVLASNSVELIEWANSFLSGSGVSQEITLQKFQDAVEDYMARGFRHFVLDLIAFSPEERSVDPILYRFNSSTLYYPLLITSPLGGIGEIKLFTLTKERIDRVVWNGEYWPLQVSIYRPFRGFPYPPIQFALSRGELATIDLRINELLPEGAWLSAFDFAGNLISLNKDIMISEEAFENVEDSPQNPSEHTAIDSPIALIVLCFLLGTASALAGVVIAFVTRRVPDKKSDESHSSH